MSFASMVGKSLSKSIKGTDDETVGAFIEVATPVKSVGRKGNKSIVRDTVASGKYKGTDKPVIVKPTEASTEGLMPRQQRATKSETSVSVMPAPGKFFDPSKPAYKGDGMTGMLKGADIDLDLDFGNYIVMGKKPQDVSNKTFQNLFITPRISNKELSTLASKTTRSKVKVDNKAIARANQYDGPDLSLEDMQDNYKLNTGKEGSVYRTNLVQPSLFKVDGNKRINHPIVAVQAMSGPEASKAFAGKATKHYYALDMQMVGPVKMDRITSRNKDGTVPQPNLRPATVGNVNLGNKIGEIKLGENSHDLYDYIEVDGSMSMADEIRKVAKYKLGGLVQRPTK
tara:strand:- start:24 stop:1046 length:1023 start_codon:yes stop_codon:yes gene_type:complete